jgi:hypothetical protein
VAHPFSTSIRSPTIPGTYRANDTTRLLRRILPQSLRVPHPSPILRRVGVFRCDWSKSGARTAKDDVIREKTSPDGKLVAEMHELTTAMHGGPDTVSVTIRQTGYPYENETIYSRVYECDDFSGFDLQWKRSNELTISYGNCNGRWQTPDENRVLETKSTWRDVKIEYRDSGHVAIN